MNPEMTIEEWIETNKSVRVQVLCVALRMYKQQKEAEDRHKYEKQIGGLEAHCMLNELEAMFPEDSLEAEITFITRYQPIR